MNFRGVKAFVVGLMALFVTLPAWAHHSFAAAYNMQDPITITGKIVEVKLNNPHSHFYLDVTDKDGKTVRWIIEGGTPGGMLRNGYSPQIIKQGDTVTIKGFRARNASNNGMLTELVLADGTVYGMFGPQQSAPGK